MVEYGTHMSAAPTVLLFIKHAGNGLKPANLKLARPKRSYSNMRQPSLPRPLSQ